MLGIMGNAYILGIQIRELGDSVKSVKSMIREMIDETKEKTDDIKETNGPVTNRR